LANTAGFLQCALSCLAVPRTAPAPAPAPLVNLNSHLELLFREFGDLTAPTEVMFATLTVGTISFPQSYFLHRIGHRDVLSRFSETV